MRLQTGNNFRKEFFKKTFGILVQNCIYMNVLQNFGVYQISGSQFVLNNWSMKILTQYWMLNKII